MKTVKTNVYTFNELSDDAQETAIENNRDINVFYNWYDVIYDDVYNIAEIIGIDIDNIYFSGFWSQGDGACFEGSYSYNKGAHKKIKEYAPKDKELHNIVTQLWDLQSENFYSLSATVKHRGHYYHEHCTDIDVYSSNRTHKSVDEEVSTFMKENLRDFMRWIYNRLEKEYNYLISDEAIKLTLIANEYEFTEDGKRW